VKQLEKLDRIELKDNENREFDIKFNIRIKPGKVVTDILEVSKSYGDMSILRNGSAQVLRGDKIALIGANGKGKSTLLRMIAGTEPYDGKIDLGWNVETAFFAQHQLESLNLKSDLLNEIGTVSAEYTEKDLRTVLGCFLFTGEEVFKKVKVLSGGEKSRLALAKTLITQSNFLLLDEPTNHLDMFSAAVLAESLDNYEGSLLFVSHDRTFISRVANKIWWIENGQLREYPGTYDEYNEWIATRPAAPVVVEEKPKAVVESKSAVTSVKTGVSKNQIQRWETQMKELQEKIDQFDLRRTQLEESMVSPEVVSKSDELLKLTAEHVKLLSEISKLQKEYDDILEQWMENHE
jgi:ATP-binding cassette subfamily F protein 3